MRKIKNQLLFLLFRAGSMSLQGLVLVAAAGIALAALTPFTVAAEENYGTDLTAKPLPVILGVTLNSSIERYQGMLGPTPAGNSELIIYSRAADAGKTFGGAAIILTAYYAYKNIVREINIRIAAADVPKIMAWLDGQLGPSGLGNDALPRWRTEAFSLYLSIGDSALTRDIRIVYDKDTRETDVPEQ